MDADGDGDEFLRCARLDDRRLVKPTMMRAPTRRGLLFGLSIISVVSLSSHGHDAGCWALLSFASMALHA